MGVLGMINSFIFGKKDDAKMQKLAEQVYAQGQETKKSAESQKLQGLLNGQVKPDEK